MNVRAHPPVVALCSLAVFGVFFVAFQSRLSDGVFVIGNILPLAFGALFGFRWGLTYAVVHSVLGVGLAGITGFSSARLVSNGIPATIVTVVMSGAVGRIRDLSTSLRHELLERRRYELELQEHRLRLESLVAERTAEILEAYNRLREETAEREQAEVQKRNLEASLRRAEKMEAIGILAGSVAHDLNNILGSLIGYPDLLLLELPENSPMREALHAIRESGLRAAAIVQDLLTMARRGVMPTQVIDLNEVVTNVMRSSELQRLGVEHRDALIETSLGPGPLSIHGSAVHLGRAILNLVLNALEAIDGRGQVKVSTERVYVDTPSGRYEALAEGEYVTLTVEDTGRGIAPEDLGRIFEPFYSKKVMGRSGTGLGMAIVWGTMKDHGGIIDVRSDLGRGTAFTLFLPPTAEAFLVEPLRLNIEECLGHGESILVVDDVAAQRDLCVAILSRLGYAAACVGSGEEAVEQIRRGPVDLLVLDMIMEPGIDGLTTYRRIVGIRPGQRAVLVSGFSESQQVTEAQALGAGAYVRKPYTLEKLAVTVRDGLRGRG